MKPIYRSAKSRIETVFNKNKQRVESPYPKAKPNRTRTLAEDLALAERLRNDDNAFFEWFAEEGYCYARLAHLKCRPYYTDLQNEISDLIFTVRDAVKKYGRSKDPNKKVLPLSNFCMFCCRRRLYTIGRRWKNEKKISFCDVNEQVHDSGMVDNKSEPPDFNYCLKEFIEHIKTLLSTMELAIFEQLLIGKKPTEIYGSDYQADDYKNSQYKIVDNAFQRISNKLKKDKKCLAFYEQLCQSSQWRNYNHNSNRDIWEWAEFSIKQRSKR